MASYKQGFDIGYSLAVRHVIERVAMNDDTEELVAELRRFYANDLAANERHHNEKAGMTSTQTAIDARKQTGISQ